MRTIYIAALGQKKTAARADAYRDLVPHVVRARGGVSTGWGRDAWEKEGV